MTKRILVLVIATAALGGGFLALRGKRSPNKSIDKAPAGPLLLPPSPPLLLLPPPSIKPLLHPHFPHPFHLTPRVAGLLIAAVVLTVTASIGMGKGSEVANAATAAPRAAAAALGATPAPSEPQGPADDMIRFSSAQERLAAFAVEPAPAAAPDPTPAVAAEVAVPTPEPALEPAAVPPPAPTAAPVIIPADGIEAIICALPWPCAEAVAVAACESGRDMQGRLDGNWATNGANFGLFQINAVHAYRWADFYEAWMDPARNAQWAYEIWLDSGWYPWDCRWAAYS